VPRVPKVIPKMTQKSSKIPSRPPLGHRWGPGVTFSGFSLHFGSIFVAKNKPPGTKWHTSPQSGAGGRGRQPIRSAAPLRGGHGRDRTSFIILHESTFRFIPLRNSLSSGGGASAAGPCKLIGGVWPFFDIFLDSKKCVF